MTATKQQPKFFPKPNQVDFSDARWAPVINCVLKFGEKILLVERSKRLKFYPGYWNGISGFLDDNKSLEEKVYEELQEELGLETKDIQSIKLGQVFNQDDPEYKKTWIVHPVLVEVNTDRVKIDWEAQEYRWVTFEKAKLMKLLPGFEKVLFSFSV